MPVHLDDPAPGIAFMPAEFHVRGWVWLEERHDSIAGVVATSGDIVFGQADVSEFFERPDVSAMYRLPAGTRTSFDFIARHPPAWATDSFVLELRVRKLDGTLTEPIFTRPLTLPRPEFHPGRMLCDVVPRGAIGLEIGAHTLPVPGITPFYTDMVASYAGIKGRADFLSDARVLPLMDAALDYLCSSHVLEHLSDPIAALHEWHRVLRPGGWLYLVVPDKRFTFDAPRPTTTLEHLLRDFETGPTFDGTSGHIDEFVFQTDWAFLHPHTPASEHEHQKSAARESYLRELEAGRPIDIHYHTFTPDSLHAVLRAAGFVEGRSPLFKIVSSAERYPPGREDGFGVLLQKTGQAAREHRGSETFTVRGAPRSPSGTGKKGSSEIATASELPVVCPVSLQSLHLATNADGTSELVAVESGLRYSFLSELPALLPVPGEKPIRSWGARGWPEAGMSGRGSASSLMRGHLDVPYAGSAIDPLCIYVHGWLWLDDKQTEIAAVEMWAGNVLIGETTALYDRADVRAALSLPADAATGFELFAHHPAAAPDRPLVISLRARLVDGTVTPVLFSVTAKTIPRDYRQNHFGVLLDQRTTAIQRHDNVFATGPSQAEGSGELAYLLRRYLGPPPRRIVDVGCGFGSYGRGLLAEGYDWLGVEIDAVDCMELKRQGLPHQQVDGRTLPFADNTFDAALCLEVLEHIDDPRAFLREISRVAPRQLIVSVPNCELLGYLWDYLATPWHMLESTHVNYFTRWSLSSLLREFYPHVEVRFHTAYPLQTIEGTPLYYNLLAIARAAP